MRRRATIAALVTVAMGLALVGWLGSGGSAAPTSDRPTKQELARKLLETKGLQLTPAARAFVARVAEGGERGAEPEGAEAPRAEAGAATAAGPAVRLAGRGLRSVRVNDPARDRHQQDQTTQSETTIAVAGRNVAVGYNDSQQSLLFTTQGTSLSGYSWSSDGGRTWTVAYAARHSLAEGCSVTQYLGAQPIVDPANGTLYVAAERFQVDDPQCQGAELVTSEVIFKSTDGGRTFGPAVKIADITPAGTAETAAGPAVLLGPGKAMRTAEFPVLAFHRSVLYVAWNEARGGHSHLRLASSTNAGASWSLRWLTGGNADEAQPALSGDREGLHVLYYSIAPTRPNRLIDVAVLDSSDGSTFRARQYFAWGDNRDRVRNWLYPNGRHDPNVYFARR
jgi:hypothetical protein